jgi:hypothetical protein
MFTQVRHGAAVLAAGLLATALAGGAGAQSVLDPKPGANGDLHSPIMAAWPGPFTPVEPGVSPGLSYVPHSVKVISTDPKIVFVVVTVDDAELLARGRVMVGDADLNCRTGDATFEEVDTYDARDHSGIDRQYPAKGGYDLGSAANNTQLRELLNRLCSST